MKKGSIFIAFGLLLCGAALCLTGYNFWDDQRAGEAAQNVLEQLTPKITQAASSEAQQQPEKEEILYPDYVRNPQMEMPVEFVDGKAYIGLLSLPTVNREYPVCSQWSYSDLKTAPCRYSGSAYLDDLVICGHNYSTHFGPIRDLEIGDRVLFTDVDGHVFSYVVVVVETLPPTEVESMTSGEWDLTLFTCTTGAQNRVAVRCDRDLQ